MENLTEENNDRLNTLIEIIEDGIKYSTAAIKVLPDNEGHSPETFMHLNFLERFTSCLYGIYPLMKEFRANRWVEMGIGLTLRASLLDFMTLLYLDSYKSEGTVEEFEDKLTSFMCDTISNTLKYSKVCKDVGVLDIQEYESVINDLYNSYNALFKPGEGPNIEKPESSLIGVRFATPVEQFKRIYQQQLTKNHAGVYDAYIYYSKYEHFGIVTYDLKRLGKNEEFEQIHTSLRFLFRGLTLILAYLSLQFDVRDSLSSIEKLSNRIENL